MAKSLCENVKLVVEIIRKISDTSRLNGNTNGTVHEEINNIVDNPCSAFGNGAELNDVFEELWAFNLPSKIMYPLSIAMSFLCGINMTYHYFRNSRMKITSKHKWLNFIISVASLVYITTSFIGKIITCITITGVVEMTIPLMAAFLKTPGEVNEETKLQGHVSFVLLVIMFIVIPASLVIAPLGKVFGAQKIYEDVTRHSTAFDTTVRNGFCSRSAKWIWKMYLLWMLYMLALLLLGMLLLQALPI